MTTRIYPSIENKFSLHCTKTILMWLEISFNLKWEKHHMNKRFLYQVCGC